MSGTEIQIQTKDGERFMGYLAAPSSSKGPGVLIIQEIFGVNANVRATADRYAAAGYFALAPDLFWRQEPGIQLTDKTQAEWDKAFELYRGFDVDKGVADLGASLDQLRSYPGVSGKIGAVGYCLGGLLAYLVACRTSIDAAVGYYGVGIDGKLGEAAAIKKPLMLHIASADAFVDATAQKAMHDGLGGNPLVTLHDYPGMDHAFTRPGGQHYNQENTEIAHRRTMEFFAQHLAR